MVTVDVIVDPENLPRIRLLQAHMSDLQVDLKLHETLPDQHSARLIYVPRKTDSQLKQLLAADAERIALYLDEGAEQIDADMAVQLYSWPARSSDPHVRTLARHLKRHLEKPLSTGSANTESASKQAAQSNASSERRKNVVTLLAIGAVVLVVMTLMELNDEAREQDRNAAPAAERTNLGEPLDAPTRGEDSTPHQPSISPGQIEESSEITADKTEIALPLATFPKGKQTIAPCAGANELLRAPLRWQLPTDLEPCAG